MLLTHLHVLQYCFLLLLKFSIRHLDLGVYKFEEACDLLLIEEALPLYLLYHTVGFFLLFE
jgi:hypothetical protein